MEFKTNYVEGAAKELEMSVGEYLKNTDFNYVIFYKGKVDTFSDGNPVIYGDEMEVLNEIGQSNGFDENGKMKPEFLVMTEWDFICTYCKDWLVTYLANYIPNDDNNEYDGCCWIHWLDGFDNIIDLNDGMYTDILGAYVGSDGALSFSVCDKDTKNITFVGLWEFEDDSVVYKIAMSILCDLNLNQIAID